jgi:hypothetical protein
MNMAPFPLVTYANTQTDVPGSGNPIWKEMGVVLTPADMMPALMPPNPPFLTDAGFHTLIDWIDAGAPPAPEGGACE